MVVYVVGDGPWIIVTGLPPTVDTTSMDTAWAAAGEGVITMYEVTLEPPTLVTKV